MNDRPPSAGAISGETRWFALPEPFDLECGERLSGAELAYRTWGSLAPGGDNAVLVCHALTGSADADVWWRGLFGPGRALDPARDFVVCSNVLGSCYGSTGPLALHPDDGEPWGGRFPRVTVRDMVRAQAALLDHLGVERLALVLGPSLGGMQVLEWAASHPERVEACAPIGVSGRHSAWCIGISEAQRQAIYADPDWRNGRYPASRPPARGLAAARMMAMCAYRSWDNFESRFGRRLRESGEFDVESYLRYQGRKLVERFDAASYVRLTEAMDSHDLARGRGEYETVLASIDVPALIVSVDSDVLYPPHEQALLAEHMPNAVYRVLHTTAGHDGFLIEMGALDEMLKGFLATVRERAAARGALAG